MKDENTTCIEKPTHRRFPSNFLSESQYYGSRWDRNNMNSYSYEYDEDSFNEWNFVDRGYNAYDDYSAKYQSFNGRF